jgi:hypothetical protein
MNQRNGAGVIPLSGYIGYLLIDLLKMASSPDRLITPSSATFFCNLVILGANLLLKFYLRFDLYPYIKAN